MARPRLVQVGRKDSQGFMKIAQRFSPGISNSPNDLVRQGRQNFSFFPFLPNREGISKNIAGMAGVTRRLPSAA